MHRFLSSVAYVVVGLITMIGTVGCAPSARPIHVLMIATGQSHDYEKLPISLADHLMSRGDMIVEVTGDLADLNAHNINRYDVLIFNVCTQAELDESTRRVIVECVRSGKGLVPMHCAFWSFQSWPEWRELVGGLVLEHDHYGPYSVTVLDPDHAAMLSLGGMFEITDEPYLVDEPDPNAEVLIRTTEIHKNEKGKKRPGTEPQVWTKRYGQGRVFAVTFGHDQRAQNDENFITLLHNGIRWSAGRLADTAHNVLTKSEQQAGFELLFNGKDLTGWSGDPDHWTVENGQLVGRASNLSHNVFLATKKEYSDFVLRLSVKLINSNSGVQFRSKAYPDYVVKGCQADIADRWWGCLYDEGGKRGVIVDSFEDCGSKVLRHGGWNHMTIKALGPKITITLNGLTTAEYEETDPTQPAKGVIALQLHKGEPMEVRFRDIRIRPLNG